MFDDTTRKILDLPRIELTEERLNVILEKKIKKVRLEMKKQTMLLLMECHNRQMTISEAIVMINNFEYEQ